MTSVGCVTRRRILSLVVGAMVGAAIVSLAACGTDEADIDDQPPQDSLHGSLQGEITVFAAASLSGAFEAIGEAFEAAHPGVDVTFAFAASSELAVQINEGAPADVFASADINNMTKVTNAGNATAPTVFAHNAAAIIVAPGNPLGIAGVADLVDNDLILVMCAVEVPCGAYGAEIFANANIAPTPDSYEANVKAVVNKVVLGEADAGIAYTTDVFAAGDDAAGVEIPADINVVAEYPMAVTSGAPNPVAGAAFVEFVLGNEAQQILNGFGFTSP